MVVAQSSASYKQRLQKRQEAFRKIIRTEKGKKAKIAKALAVAEDQNSIYRKDAIRFLAEVQAVSAVATLARIGRESPEVRDEVVVAMTKLQSNAAIDYLIEVLDDGDKTGIIRGISIRALRNITGQDFNYSPDDPQPQLNAGKAKWQAWWDKSRDTFKRKQTSRDEQQEAEEIWEKYGIPYLNRDN